MFKTQDIPFIRPTSNVSFQDFANQIRWSEEYLCSCKREGKQPGKYLSPLAGEFVSGSFGNLSQILFMPGKSLDRIAAELDIVEAQFSGC